MLDLSCKLKAYKKNYKKVEFIMAKEMTRVEAIVGAIELAKGAKATELQEKLESILAAEQKAKGRKTVSKTAKEKNADMELIKEFFLEADGAFTSDEIIASIEAFEGYTPQKMTSRLSALVNEGFLFKGKKDKKVAYTTQEV